MTDQIIVYSKPQCPQCDATKRYLDKNGVRYTVVDLATNPEALDHVKNTLGHTRAPVVEAGTNNWSGHNPTLLNMFCVDGYNLPPEGGQNG